jgi:hypothetical protein
MQPCIKFRTAKLCPFLSAFIRVNPRPIMFSPRCPILGMGLFRKRGFRDARAGIDKPEALV